ncbi:hypothetical protein ENSA5_56760 [Enhygromyxa salina]|uniref:Uncharacterized protein n=2 Tax=Enhygromyxa salina TaxID=215803 RepID=A0A2S9XEI1_9BACT|nr:hypothetical protein ENSA5_56760 [Enhygromyxa salina]
MHWQAVPGLLHIVVHTEESPSDEDWDKYLADVVEHAAGCKGVLVYTRRAGPSAQQRARSNAAFESFGSDSLVAIMTGSRLTLGIVTAVSWVVGGNIKAFSTHDFEGAAAHLGLDPTERIRARIVLKQLARSAGLDIDAFADESGRFRRRYEQ